MSFRDLELAKNLVADIKQLHPSHRTVICHVCGTHEWTVTHFGLRSLLPDLVEVIAGPGCPVCVLPAADIDVAVELARKGVTITTFGDVLRVPGSHSSLAEAKAEGGDVRVVYSIQNAATMARKEPNRDFAFFAIGFETTAPLTANEILKAPPNLSFLSSHRLIPPAMEFLLGVGDLQIDGFIAPGHVSTIIGLDPYRVFADAYHMPVVVAGFEPIDVLFAIDMILRQTHEGEARLENEYNRAVKPEGNLKALDLMAQVFDVVQGGWRGLGKLPQSALSIKDEFIERDAHQKHQVTKKKGRDFLPGCQCHLVMMGKIKPSECPLFMEACTPSEPRGACMVSTEGTCRIWALHGGSGLQ
ncbi:MAG: hydrogenase formation protein HypD [Candidatus Bathyarchaeota archaeon]|nr:MAG: hydrogenase formation protein HypD [Candidatus Bathyarchaeota archaeon]